MIITCRVSQILVIVLQLLLSVVEEQPVEEFLVIRATTELASSEQHDRRAQIFEPTADCLVAWRFVSRKMYATSTSIGVVFAGRGLLVV